MAICSLCFNDTNVLSQSTNFSTYSHYNEFLGENAYHILGVAETSTPVEIKASFRRLAKETHPDTAQSSADPITASKRFVQIVAAYEILSNSEKRACYDQYLSSQKEIPVMQTGVDLTLYGCQLDASRASKSEVVEWLQWYRFAIEGIVSQGEIVGGSSYFDELQSEFYSAIRAAYFGPVVDTFELLPDRFEAEVRSVYDTPEILHLVSGRDLFGVVSLADKCPLLSECHHRMFSYLSNDGSSIINPLDVEKIEDEIKVRHHKDNILAVYKNLILHISGKAVAYASRIPPKSCQEGFQHKDFLDHIHVFLMLNESQLAATQVSSSPHSTCFLLGTITGLGTSPEEGACDVYNNLGAKTHVIMKHRTLLVCGVKRAATCISLWSVH